MKILTLSLLYLCLLFPIVLNGCIAAKKTEAKDINEKNAGLLTEIKDNAIEVAATVEAEASLTRKENIVQAEKIKQLIQNQGTPISVQITIAILSAIVIITLFALQIKTMLHTKCLRKHLEEQ